MSHLSWHGGVKSNHVECVIVLPSKLFYGNNVPGCLVVLNKRKVPERGGKVLLIWASRHYQANNPQNLLRRSDCLRVLVPWRAFGDLEKCCALVPKHETELIADIERERDINLAEIEAAYQPFLAPLPAVRQEVCEREEFASKEAPEGKDERKKFREEKKANAERLKDLKRELKALEKIEAEAEEKRRLGVLSLCAKFLRRAPVG